MVIRRRHALFVFLAAAACSAAKAVMPAIALPPPPASTMGVIGGGLVVPNAPGKLGDAADRLAAALEKAGFEGWSAYSVADDGFAFVTRIERIDATGNPRPDRFSARRVPYRYRGFSPDDIKQVLFNEPPGRYRVFLFAVTAHLLSSEFDHPPVVRDVDTEDLAAGKLPSEIRKRPAPNGGCQVLVYEFERPREVEQPAQTVAQSAVPALDHVARAGIFGRAELR